MQTTPRPEDLPTAQRPNVRRLQRPLRTQYLADPPSAQVIDHAASSPLDSGDPFHALVRPKGLEDAIRVAVHVKHGGPQDGPTPGDLLCASLSVCYELTIRMAANHLGLAIERLEVEAHGEVDLRGSLGMGGQVGFQAMRVTVRIRLSNHDDDHLRLLLAAAEQFCVVTHTLREGVPVSFETAAAESPQHA